MDIVVTRDVLSAMLSAAKAAHPLEACGILFGEGAAITGFRSAANVHPQPARHFEIDPQTLIDAYRSEREGGPKIVGYFHSHPTGDPHPSETDRSCAAGDGKVWAIVGEDRLMFWRDDAAGFVTLSYDVI